MTGDQEASVRVQALRRTFGSFVAVDGIDLSVKKGEIFGFLGPNGAGKSTTIRMLCGLLLPTSGIGKVGGFDILTQTDSIKNIIGYMSQRFSLYEDLKVEENINFFAGIYRIPYEKRDARRRWVLSMSGLEGKRSELTGTLAAGFKQRLALGCAILHEPPILFLDEPTSGVDPVSRRNFWSLIRELAERGTTIFVTTHYMEEADYCDTLALIYKGKIIAEGTPTELRHNYMTGEIFEVEVGSTFEAMAVLERHGIESSIFGSTLHALVEGRPDARSEIEIALTSSGIEVEKIEKITPSLEDVFVKLIEVS